MANVNQSAETTFAIKAEKVKNKNSVLKFEVSDLIMEKAHEKRGKVFNGILAFVMTTALGVVVGLGLGGII